MADNVQQKGFRFRDDSAALNTDAGWLAALNTDIAVNVFYGDVFARLRFVLENDGTVSYPATMWWAFEYRVNGGTWLWLGDTYVATDTSAKYSQGDSTTQLIGSGSFTGGSAASGNSLVMNIALATGNETEFEVAMLFEEAGDLVQDDVVDFRMTRWDGGQVPLETYTVTPTVTISRAEEHSGSASIHHYVGTDQATYTADLDGPTANDGWNDGSASYASSTDANHPYGYTAAGYNTYHWYLFDIPEVVPADVVISARIRLIVAETRSSQPGTSMTMNVEYGDDSSAIVDSPYDASYSDWQGRALYAYGSEDWFLPADLTLGDEHFTSSFKQALQQRLDDAWGSGNAFDGTLLVMPGSSQQTWQNRHMFASSDHATLAAPKLIVEVERPVGTSTQRFGSASIEVKEGKVWTAAVAQGSDDGFTDRYSYDKGNLTSTTSYVGEHPPDDDYLYPFWWFANAPMGPGDKITSAVLRLIYAETHSAPSGDIEYAMAIDSNDECVAVAAGTPAEMWTDINTRSKYTVAGDNTVLAASVTAGDELLTHDFTTTLQLAVNAWAAPGNLFLAWLYNYSSWQEYHSIAMYEHATYDVPTVMVEYDTPPTGSKGGADAGTITHGHTTTASGVHVEHASGAGTIAHFQSAAATGNKAASSAASITSIPTVSATGDAFEAHVGSASIGHGHTTVAYGAEGSAGSGQIIHAHTTVASGTTARNSSVTLPALHASIASGQGFEPHAGTGSITQSHSVVATGAAFEPHTGIGTITHDHSVTASGVHASSDIALVIHSHATVATGVKLEILTILSVDSDYGIGSDEFDFDENDLDLIGAGFGPTQGTASVYLSDAATLDGSLNEIDVTDTVVSWSTTLVNLDLTTASAPELAAIELLGLTAHYFIIVNDSAVEGSSGLLTAHRAKAFGMADSTQIAPSGEDTTPQLTSPAGKDPGDFGGGRIQDDENPSDTVDLGVEEYGEWEWSTQAVTPVDGIYLGAQDAETYEFRVLFNGALLDTYTTTPEWTIGDGDRNGFGSIVETHAIAATGIKHAAEAASIVHGHTAVAYGAEGSAGSAAIVHTHTTVATGIHDEAATGAGTIPHAHTVVATGVREDTDDRSGSGTITSFHTVTALGDALEPHAGSASIVHTHDVTATGVKDAAFNASIVSIHTITATGVAFEPHAGSASIVQGHTVVAIGIKSDADERAGQGSIVHSHTATAIGIKGASSSAVIALNQVIGATGVAFEYHAGAASIAQTHTVVAHGAEGSGGNGVIVHGHADFVVGVKDTSGDAVILNVESVVAVGTKYEIPSLVEAWGVIPI